MSIGTASDSGLIALYCACRTSCVAEADVTEHGQITPTRRCPCTVVEVSPVTGTCAGRCVSTAAVFFGLEGDARRFAVHVVNSFLRLVPHLGSSPAGRLGYLHSEELKNGSTIPWERKGSALQVVQHVPTQLWYQSSSASGALTHTCTKTKFPDLVVSSAVPVHHPSL